MTKYISEKEAKERIEKLKKEINHHRYLYHVTDRIEISDDALDSLKHELKMLEDRFPHLITKDSPTQRVGGRALDKFEKVRHAKPMLSLEDAFKNEEMEAWRDRLQKLMSSEKMRFFVELKIDGFAISLRYRNGVLKTAATRGDGKTGEDVTQNIRTISSVPLRLEMHGNLSDARANERLNTLLAKGIVEVRGEVYMTITAFEAVNVERKKQGLALYANPRNTAAGSIRQLDPSVAASRKLDFLAYELVTDIGQTTHAQEHEACATLGFKTDARAKVCEDLRDVFAFHEEIKRKREKLSHQIDGIVVRINDNAQFRRAGYIGKAPRGAIAFKYPGVEATTRVDNIIVQVGRTGVLTPVAALEPVEVGGVTVTRATLHNEDEIERLGLKIGDTVIVQRAGDVIPDIVRVIAGLRTGKEKTFIMPDRCPSCGKKVERKAGEAAHKCLNKKCPAKQRERLYHFTARKAFNIVGLGPKILDKFAEVGLVADPADMFSLREEDIAQLERFAEKSASNLVGAIKKSKRISLARFIYALGIEHVGEETAIVLQERFGTLEDIERATEEELSAVLGIGEVVTKSIAEWFADPYNKKLLAKLKNAGIIIESVKRKKKGGFEGISFVVTGEMESMSREEAHERIRERGGKVVSGVSKKTGIVVVGKNPGSKYDKAKQLGVKTISEKEFLEMMK